MVAATICMLGVALALQLLVYGNGGHSSLSDLPGIFFHRGIRPGALPYIDRVVEYPVGSGILLYLATLVAPTPLGVLLVTALGASVLCVGITIVLERRCGTRAWRWALATPVLLFAFQNWDMFAIAATLGALLAFDDRRDGVAGGFVAVGAAVKLFPAVLFPLLVAHRLSQGDRRGATRFALSTGLVYAALNLPFLVANSSGWWWPMKFQSHRQATWGSVWFYLYHWFGVPVHGAQGASIANVVSLAALSVGLIALTALTYRRRVEPIAAAAAAVAWFIVCNKVYSPTYDVWLVVFFVLLPLSRRLWIAFCAVDLAVYIVVFGYFHGLHSIAVVHAMLPVLVIARTLVLGGLILQATSARTARGLEPRIGAAGRRLSQLHRKG